MRTITSKVFLTLALFAALAAEPGGEARGQWVQTNGEYAQGEILTLTEIGQNLIADIGNTWCISSDSGKSWNKEYGPGYGVQSFVVLKDTLFADGDGYISFSTDHGEQWKDYDDYLSYEIGSYDICLGTDSSSLFLGTSDSGIYRYDESRNQWVPCNTGLPYQSGSYPQIRTFAAMGSLLFAGTGNNGIFRSKDHGNSWQSIGDARFQASSESIILVANGNSIYDGTYDGLFISTNRGDSWTNPEIGDGVDGLAAIGSNVFISIDGNVDGVYCSTDNGITWNPAGNGVPSFENTWITTIQALGSKLIMGTGGGGIFISSDSAKSWCASEDSGIVSELPITSLAANDVGIYAGTSDGLYCSSDEGSVWSSLGPFHQLYATTAPPIRAIECFDSNVFASTLFGAGDGSYSFYSNDNGFDWKDMNLFFSGLFGSARFNNLAKIGSDLFISMDNDGVGLSTDGGSNWTHINNGLIHNVVDTSYDTIVVTTRFGWSYDSIAVNIETINTAQIFLSLGVDGTNLFAATRAGIYLTTNNGSDWVAVDSLLTNVTSFVTLGSMIFAASHSGVFASTNGGVNWMKLNRGLADADVNCLAVGGTNLFAGTSDSGIFLSTDSGKIWSSVNANMGNLTINDLLVDRLMLYAGTQAGVWRRPLSDFGISAVSEPRPSAVTIRAYPNPFSQSTTIGFTAETAGYASVSIVNALGTEVARLYSGELAAGEHQFAWDIGKNACPNGMYECVIRMNGSVEKVGIIVMR